MVLTTNEGLLFLLIGNLVGAILSLILFSLTVVSFPLLLERDVDFVTAMITSVRAVVKSPVPMIGWAATIVLLLIVSVLPTFLGLVFTLPILGHATWHLYRRIVAPVAIGAPASPAANWPGIWIAAAGQRKLTTSESDCLLPGDLQQVLDRYEMTVDVVPQRPVIRRVGNLPRLCEGEIQHQHRDANIFLHLRLRVADFR